MYTYIPKYIRTIDTWTLLSMSWYFLDTSRASLLGLPSPLLHWKWARSLATGWTGPHMESGWDWCLNGPADTQYKLNNK